MTRLADVTGLDRLGLPVWQAIRPASRALSVHQGKALDPAGARIGALCEAIESHCAEQAEADGPVASIASLPPGERLSHPDDVLLDRAHAPDWDAPLAWSEAADLVSGRPLLLPHAFVSLDFTAGLPSAIERSSNGLGAGPHEAHALGTALMELIERDALGGWLRMSLVGRILTRIEPATIPFDWFHHWRERLAGLGATLDAFELATVTGAPAFRCTIRSEPEFGRGGRLGAGSAAHADAEAALAKAFAEAAQTRLTLIAGSRDDLYPSRYGEREGLSEPDEWPPGRPWRGWAPMPDAIGGTVERLVRLSYGQVAVKRLDRGLDGVSVVKAFVPGLGMLGRTRRVPA